MKNIAKKGIVLVIFLGIVLLLSRGALASASCVITVKNTFPGEGEFDIEILHMAELHNLFDDERIKQIYHQMYKQVGGFVHDDFPVPGRPAFLLRISIKKDSYFWPQRLQFVQEKNQYEIDYDDVMKISDVFYDVKLRADVEVYGLVFIPEGIDVDAPMKIYYEDYWTSLLIVQQSQIDPTIEEKIEELETEQLELNKKINALNAFQERLDEIYRELMRLREMTLIEAI